VLGHKETCTPHGRKTDPSFDMPAFRHQVAAVDLNTNPLEDDVDDQTIEKIAAAVAAQPIVNKTPGKPDGKSTIGGSITNIEETQDRNTTDIAAMKTEQAAQRQLLTEILARLPVAPAAG
jgi:hypothetical protein